MNSRQKNTQVIFLSANPVTKSTKEGLYFDAISQRIESELWDVSAICGTIGCKQGQLEDAFRVSNIGDFQRELSQRAKKRKIVVVTDIQQHKLTPFFDQIHSVGIPIVNINKDAFAHWMYISMSVKHPRLVGIRNYLQAVVQYPRIMRVATYLFRCQRFSRIRRIGSLYHCLKVKYDYQLSSYNFFPEASKHFVKIHNIKYDGALSSSHLAPVVNGEYILFIDAALTTHPMFYDARIPLSTPDYLKQMNDYFSAIEQRYGLPVVVSAHPKSDYAPSDFGGRQLIMNKTPELIHYAKYVVSHYSTSLYDVILQFKPFKVLYSSEMLHASCSQTVMAGMRVAELVGTESVNLDKPFFSDFTRNDSRYQHFIDTYLVNRKKLSLSNGQIISDFLLSL